MYSTFMAAARANGRTSWIDMVIISIVNTVVISTIQPIDRSINNSTATYVIQHILRTLSSSSAQQSGLTQVSHVAAGCRTMLDNTHTLFRGLWAQEETELGKK